MVIRRFDWSSYLLDSRPQDVAGRCLRLHYGCVSVLPQGGSRMAELDSSQLVAQRVLRQDCSWASQSRQGMPLGDRDGV